MDAARLTAEIRRRVHGRVSCRAADLAAHASDFGRLVHRSPGVVVWATSETDVAACLALASEHGIPVAVRGSGHSCNGQSLCAGGILLVNRARQAAPMELLEEGLVDLPARNHWGQVEAFLHRAGRTIPVLADDLRLSVGGTLSVGGYGATSIVHGAQVDHVERLRLIRPDGTAVWCSATESSDLFRYSLCGLGRMGVIERAVVRTRSYRRVTKFYVYRHASLPELVDSLGWMTGWEGEWPDLFKALPSCGHWTSLYGFQAGRLRQANAIGRPAFLSGSQPARSFACPWYPALRSRGVALWVARFGSQSRLWSDYVLDHAGLTSFARLLDDLLRREAFAGCLRSVYLLAIRRPAGAVDLPFEAAGPPTGAPKFGIGLYSMIPPGDERRGRRVREAVRACLESCIALGGRPYLYGWHRLGEEARRALYGDACDRLEELRREIDPRGILGDHKLLDG